MILAVIVLIFGAQANAKTENDLLSESQIVLTIKSDKPTYVLGEEIIVQFIFTNVSRDPIEFFVFTTDNGRSLYRWLEIGGKRTAELEPMGSVEDHSGIQVTQETILPGKHVISRVPFDSQRLAKIALQNGNSAVTSTHQLALRGGYLFPVGINISLKMGQKRIFSAQRNPFRPNNHRIEMESTK
jgi:hypothetical protein